MVIAKKRPPLPPNHKRAAGCGEAARLQKQKKWKETTEKQKKVKGNRV